MLSGEHVLVAEDECVIALDLTDMLESAGATVIGPAATVREALRLAMSEAVDRALLDFNLADGEVIPTCAKSNSFRGFKAGARQNGPMHGAQRRLV